MVPERRQIKRKQPRVDRGKSWHSSSTGKLFLDDIRFIFDILSDYAEYSPFLHQRREVNESIRNAHAQSIRVREALGEDVSNLELPQDDLMPSVTIEADDWIVHSIEDLESLQLNSIRDFQMGVGFGNLTFDCDRFGCGVRTNQDDDKSVAAFEEICRRIKKRQINVLRLLHNKTTFVVSFSLFALLYTTSSIVDNEFITSATGIVTIVIFLYFLWYGLFWDRRTVVVPMPKRDVSPPWYVSNEMKVGVTLAIVAALVAKLLGVI